MFITKGPTDTSGALRSLQIGSLSKVWQSIFTELKNLSKFIRRFKI